MHGRAAPRGWCAGRRWHRSLEWLVHITAVMKTTIGQLVSKLFETYEHRYHDEELAAIATEVMLDDILRVQRRRTRPHRAA